MTKKHKSRSGSLAYYPRKRALKETPTFTSFKAPQAKEGEASKPLNFLAYKAGMAHVLGKDTHPKGTTVGQEVASAVTVLEAPPLKVFGIRAYAKDDKGYGSRALFDVLAERQEKHLARKIGSFGAKKEGKKGVEAKEGKKAKAETVKQPKTVGDLEKEKARILEVCLLVHTQPYLTGIGKKKPEVSEVKLSGNVGQQTAFAMEKLGKEISAEDVFAAPEFVDVKAVTKGKGIQGVVKRFGIKTARPKAKKTRTVGAISPWNPSTVMWTVARAGQMGYHTRTEYNKKILKIAKPEEVNPGAGFSNYGLAKNTVLLLAGSIPGPAKRVIGLRKNIRKVVLKGPDISQVDYISK
ncbi:MAG: 50S ribosomal protein L3 [Candidatus Diapherotrites archaeon]|nr:50S ribosomal protein L3 [Candidatus Diapherotrites archaeon]